MNIAYVSDSIIPSRYANSVQVMSMCQAFSKNGHQVTLYAEGSPFSQYKDRYGFMPAFKVIRHQGPKVNMFRRICHGVRIRTTMPLPDLLYGRDLKMLSKLIDTGIPIVYEAHKPPFTEKTIGFHRQLFNYDGFKRLVIISTGLLNEYLKIFPDLCMDKVLIAPNGAEVCDQEFQALREWPGRKGTLQLGYLGNLYPGKGMEIIDKLAYELPEMDFHVVGGWEKDIAYWKGQCHYDNIYFHGFVDHGNTPSYLDKFDILLAPFQKRITTRGRGDISTFTSPIKLLEYLAAGKAIVSSNLPVLSDILINGSNAILVDSENVDEWVRTIRELQNREDIREALGRQARKDLIAKFTWKKRAESVLEGIG